MSSALAAHVTGHGDAGVPPRDPQAWLTESIGWLALMATRRTYRADPGLWRLGEHGRARTVEDFSHHLRAALGGEDLWHRHLEYCIKLFDARGFPQRWLYDAFSTLRGVLADSFPADVTQAVDSLLGEAPAVLAELAAAAGIELNRPTSYDPPGE